MKMQSNFDQRILADISDTTKVCNEDIEELSVLDSFNLDKLKLLIKKVIVYGEDKIEIIWKADNPF